jgi:hypothetical protein
MFELKDLKMLLNEIGVTKLRISPAGEITPLAGSTPGRQATFPESSTVSASRETPPGSEG